MIADNPCATHRGTVHRSLVDQLTFRSIPCPWPVTQRLTSTPPRGFHGHHVSGYRFLFNYFGVPKLYSLLVIDLNWEVPGRFDPALVSEFLLLAFEKRLMSQVMCLVNGCCESASSSCQFGCTAIRVSCPFGLVRDRDLKRFMIPLRNLMVHMMDRPAQRLTECTQRATSA